MTMNGRKGSALVMAIWVILVLSVIVISFAFEAKQQGGINFYVENKNRVKRQLEAGKIIGEVVMLNYSEVADWSDGEDIDKLLEDDRWIREKRELKSGQKCSIGPILLDRERPDSGTIKVEISAATQSEVSSGDRDGGVNINLLCEGSNGDQNAVDRWRAIFDMAGIPKEVTDDEGKRINLRSFVIACWQDYLDEDDTRYDYHDKNSSNALGDAEGAEKKEYEEYYDDHKKEFADEERYAPANAAITDLHELSRVLCFQKFPALLTGGVLNPWEKNKEAQVTISSGLLNLGIFGIEGDGKLNVNTCTARELMTVPGIYDLDDLEDDDFGTGGNRETVARTVAEAIVKCRSIKPEDYDVDETQSSWPYKDWADLQKRVEDAYPDAEFSDDADAAKEYLMFKPDEGALFKMKITASLMDMEYSAECECYVKDKKVRYTSWKEN